MESLNASLSSIVSGKSMLTCCFIGGSSVMGYRNDAVFGIR